MEHTKMRAGTIASVTVTLLSLCGASCMPIKDLYQQGVARSRRPGQEMVASPESTMKNHCCAPYEQDTLYLEAAEALPQMSFPGDEVNHRIRYAFCPRVPSGVMSGRLVRRVLFEGRQVFRDADNVKFSPGTWTVDAFIRIPRSAPTGWYALQLEIYCPGKTIRRTSSFFVKRDKKAGGKGRLTTEASR